MTPDLAMIYLFAGNFAPQGYALCNGQIVAISTNTALFSLIGTYYGGNGQNNFALPDLRGRVPIHQGQGAGLSAYSMGQIGGAETDSININQLPAHSHSLNAYVGVGNTGTPSGAYLAPTATGSGPNATLLKSYSTNPANVPLGPNSIGSTGGGQPFSILQPYLTISYVIAMQGVFPSRN